MQARRHRGATPVLRRACIPVGMLGSLSLIPSLAVAGVTTSVSLAAAMGGVQGLPQGPDRPALIRTADLGETATLDVAAAGFDRPQDLIAAAPAATPSATPAPTATPAAPPPVVPANRPPIPVTAAPPPPPKPANTSQCWSWTGWQWTLTWCATANGGTWTATNGSQTYSGSTTYSGGAPYSGSSWGTSSGATYGSRSGGTSTGGASSSGGRGGTPTRSGRAKH